MKTISFGQAWAYCFTTTSYVLWLIVAAIVAGTILFALFKDYKKNQDWSGMHNVFLFIAVAIMFVALLIRPAEIAANTTVEQFERGVIIGY